MDKDIFDVWLFTKITHNEPPSLIYKLMIQYIREKNDIRFQSILQWSWM